MANILTDNSASRQIACKLGISRLRHVNGRLLWIQSKVRDNVLKMKVGALWNHVGESRRHWREEFTT